MKWVISVFVVALSLSSFLCEAQKKGRIKIKFENDERDESLFLGSHYTNSFNEEYTVTKCQYYISNILLKNNHNKIISEKDSYHLITEERNHLWQNQDSAFNQLNSFSFDVKPGIYESISFLVGVDSIKNVSGAQAGELDPLKGMFWTWSTGYIMFKLEGTSPQSNIIDNKFEYHIGGSNGNNNVLRRVELPLQSLKIKKGNHAEIVITAHIDKLWQSVNNLKISETPVCTSAGKMAAAIADNYSKIFSIDIINNE